MSISFAPSASSGEVGVVSRVKSEVFETVMLVRIARTEALPVRAPKMLPRCTIFLCIERNGRRTSSRTSSPES